MEQFVRSTVLLIVLLNPFALSAYLVDIFRTTSLPDFRSVMLRASAISGAIFALFAVTGETVFTDVLQVRFASFQVFGGILFLIVALRFMVSGSDTLVQLRGEPTQIAGTVAMPFMIGPGTVSAATLAGLKLSWWLGIASVAAALLVTVLVLLVLKLIFDRVREKNARLVERYVAMASRISAMVIGSIAVEMTFSGVERWLSTWQP